MPMPKPERARRDQSAAVASNEMAMAMHRIAEEHDLTDAELIRAVTHAASGVVAGICKGMIRVERDGS